MNRAALKAEIEAALASDSATNWEAKFFEAGVPAGRVMSVPEILAHPHLESREFIREFAGDGATSGNASPARVFVYPMPTRRRRDTRAGSIGSHT